MHHHVSISTVNGAAAPSGVTSDEVRLEPIRDIGEIEAWRESWSRLHDRCRGATPFQSPEWLIPWWRHLGEGELYAFAALTCRDLVGVLPMYIWTPPDSQRREVLLLGAGTSDYLDVLCEAQYRNA